MGAGRWETRQGGAHVAASEVTGSSSDSSSVQHQFGISVHHKRNNRGEYGERRRKR